MLSPRCHSLWGLRSFLIGGQKATCRGQLSPPPRGFWGSKEAMRHRGKALHLLSRITVFFCPLALPQIPFSYSALTSLFHADVCLLLEFIQAFIHLFERTYHPSFFWTFYAGFRLGHPPWVLYSGTGTSWRRPVAVVLVSFVACAGVRASRVR